LRFFAVRCGSLRVGSSSGGGGVAVWEDFAPDFFSAVAPTANLFTTEVTEDTEWERDSGEIRDFKFEVEGAGGTAAVARACKDGGDTDGSVSTSTFASTGDFEFVRNASIAHLWFGTEVEARRSNIALPLRGIRVRICRNRIARNSSPSFGGAEPALDSIARLVRIVNKD
jgi:hypothetical protein